MGRASGAVTEQDNVSDCFIQPELSASSLFSTAPAEIKAVNTNYDVSPWAAYSLVGDTDYNIHTTISKVETLRGG